MSTSFLPILYVEGKDDISVISALLSRHGVHTHRGGQHLKIQDEQSVQNVIGLMPEAIQAATNRTVGFVVDIDIEIAHRWGAVRSSLSGLIDLPLDCPPDGYIGRLANYPYDFGVWLMPDCLTDNCELEDLLQTLIPPGHPLWDHAQFAACRAAELVDTENLSRGDNYWGRFADSDAVKAKMRTWLAWQRVPGAQLGAAINDRILNCDSPQAIAFLSWMKRLYGLPLDL